VSILGNLRPKQQQRGCIKGGALLDEEGARAAKASNLQRGKAAKEIVKGVCAICM